MQNKFYLYLITFIYSCSTFSEGILTPIYAFFVQKIGGGILETSWAISIFSIICGICTILIYKTHWSYKYRKECLIFGWLLWLFGLCLYLYMKTFTVLFISQILTGIGSSFSSPAFDGEYSDLIKDNPTHGWSIFEGATSIITGLASISGGYIAVHFGFGFLIKAMVTLATISFIMLVLYLYKPKTISK